MGFALLVASCIGFIALRISVRSVADLPDELLDERNCEFATERIEVAQPSIDGNDAFGVFWFSIGLCLALPSMVVAWTSEHV